MTPGRKKASHPCYIFVNDQEHEQTYSEILVLQVLNAPVGRGTIISLPQTVRKKKWAERSKLGVLISFALFL